MTKLMEGSVPIEVAYGSDVELVKNMLGNCKWSFKSNVRTRTSCSIEGVWRKRYKV